MDDLINPIIHLIPEKYRTTVAVLVPASMLVGRVYHAIVSGGGIKAIFSAIWLGTNSAKTPEPKTENKP